MEFCEKTKPKNGYASAKYKDSFKKEGKARLICWYSIFDIGKCSKCAEYWCARRSLKELLIYGKL